MKNYTLSNAISICALFLLIPLSAYRANAQVDAGALNPAEAERIISRFTAKEAEFRRALNSYSFKRDALVQSIGMGGQVIGEYHRVSQFTFDDQGSRVAFILGTCRLSDVCCTCHSFLQRLQ